LTDQKQYIFEVGRFPGADYACLKPPVVAGWGRRNWDTAGCTKQLYFFEDWRICDENLSTRSQYDSFYVGHSRNLDTG
jgi:hypothetical protein